MGRLSESRLGRAARRVNEAPSSLTLSKLARELLPGDSHYGDPLSTAGSEAPHVLGRRISALTAERPGALRELGLSALQVWQHVAEAQDRGRGDRELVILFTDLVGFSSWAVDAGDESVLELLREVGKALEPALTERGGQVVKRLGDGLMATFEDPGEALEAALEGGERVKEVDLHGYSPTMRAGLHSGRPRRIGGDYLGVDVNVAARLADKADSGQVLVSDRLLGRLDTSGLRVRRGKAVKVKGVPQEVRMHAVERSSEGSS